MAASRRLAAIVFTDIAGYTSLAQSDEAGALRLLEVQERLIRPLLETHRGRKVKSMGDGLLIEFHNALDAVECAVDLQRQVHERNTRDGERALRLRVGIHLGDVQRKGSDILGDAVNIASRVEPLADPGGVCLSEPVYVQVHNKVPYRLENLGSKNLKGVQEPMDVYRVVLPWADGEPAVKPPQVPRLAVLPLANISPDPKDEYFADGLTEELITVLSQIKGLRVISRTSVNQYKGTTKPVAQIGSELGANSVLEGSVRKAGDQLRIAVQLIDTATDEHRWAQTYDRRLEDVFAVQAEVAKKVAGALKVRTKGEEGARPDRTRTVDPESYLAYLKGLNALLSSQSEKSLDEAKREFERAVSLDPGNARAFAGLADVSHLLGIFYRSASREEMDRTSEKYASRAIELDPNLSEAHSSLGLYLYDNLEWTKAEKEAKIAISLNPSYSRARLWYSNLLMEEARAEEALRELELAEEADPRSGLIVAFHAQLLIFLRKLDEAKREIDRFKELDSSSHTYHELLAYYHIARSDFANALREALVAEALPAADGYRGPSYTRAQVYALSGKKEKARKLLAEIEKGCQPENQATLLGRAYTFAFLGDLDECFRLHERLFERREEGVQFLRLDPLAEPIRKDPRFAQLLKKVKLQ